MLATVAALLALPASGAAAAANPLAGATLQSVNYTLTIKTSRCPATATNPAAPECARLNLESSFKAGPRPQTTRAAGTKKFPSALRAKGTGRSQCTSESPSSGPQPGDGGIFLGGSALQVSNKQIPSTKILFVANRRGARWAWPQPTDPEPACKYFFGRGSISYPELPTTQYFPPSELRKKSFEVTLETTGNDFKTIEPDGTVVFGKATWKLVLGYRRYAPRKYPSFLRNARSDVR